MFPRRRTPSILQMEAAECGVACLAMVLARFGRWESLESIRARFGTSRDGMSAAALLEAAEGYRLEGRAYSVAVKALSGLPMPQVLHWEFNHFVVLDRAGNGSFTINDPACGRRRIGRAEMDRAFTGVTLVLAPGAGFARARAQGGLLRTLWETLAQSRGAAASIVATTVLLACLGILLPGLTRVFVDDYLGQGRRDWLAPLLAGMLALALMRGALGWMAAQVSLFLQTAINAAISSRILWALLRLPFPFLASRSAAEISTRMQLAGQIAGTASGPFLKIVNSAILIVGYGLAMMAYSLDLAAIVLVIAAVNVVLLWLVQGVVADASADAQMVASKAHATTVRGIALLEEARATGMIPLLFRRLLNAHVDQTNARQKSAVVTFRVAAIPYFCGNLLSLVVLGAGAYEVMRSEMTIGELLAFQMLAELFAAPLAGIVGLGSSVLSASGGVARTNDLLAGPGRPSGPEEAAPFSGRRLGGAVAVEGVAYGHGAGAYLFEPVSFEARPGEMILIAGESGSGKTTLAMILAGVLPPSAGQVRFDGQPPASLPEETLRHSIGFADTAPFFAAGTIRDALGLWDAGVAPESLRAALRDAALDEIVLARPGGLEGRIGEAGAGLSGGELQRLAIARALVLRPSILILDDATTALDPETERAVLDNLRRRGVTVIMLSSRTGLAGQFDRTLGLVAVRQRLAA